MSSDENIYIENMESLETAEKALRLDFVIHIFKNVYNR